MTTVNHWVVWIVLAAALAVGCNKGGPGSGADSPTPDQIGAEMPPASPRAPREMSEAPTNPTVIADTGNVDATLQKLTQELRDFVVRTRRVPKDFDEFATQSQVQFPPAPEGKKYAIQGQAVVLVNR
jgi:hypothetical protein